MQPDRATPKEVLVENNQRPRRLVKRVILREKLLPYVCAVCGLGPEWNGRPLVLRLDHKNGVNNDDRLENLRFLCPNCDSQTETFCGRNQARVGRGRVASRPRPCSVCGVGFTKRSMCRSCAGKVRHKVNPQEPKIVWPSVDELRARISLSNVVAVARELGVSDKI